MSRITRPLMGTALWSAIRYSYVSCVAAPGSPACSPPVVTSTLTRQHSHARRNVCSAMTLYVSTFRSNDCVAFHVRGVPRMPHTGLVAASQPEPPGGVVLPGPTLDEYPSPTTTMLPRDE